MRLDEACNATFARHETFHPRWGWIKKSYDAALRSDRAFLADDATLQLGVGKNMVRSIRFWGHAYRVLAEVQDPGNSRVKLSAPSRIGKAIFAEDGFDPYTEDPGTLWLLHWLLHAPRSDMPVWWTALCEFGAVEFTEQQLTDFASDQLGSVGAWNVPSDSSVKKDISAFLRTYAPSTGSGREKFDDLVDCPMRDLGLIRVLDASARSYRFVVGPKANLPDDIVLFAALDFLARTESESRTVAVSRLATEAGSPGRVFKLTENDLSTAIEAAAADGAPVTVARPAGITQITFDSEVVQVAGRVLGDFYKKRGLGTPVQEKVSGFAADLPASFPTIDADGFDLPVVTSAGKKRVGAAR